MDEPLASLDEARKAEILPYIERLRDEAGIPIVYVSHAVAEVARLATDVVVLAAGRVAAAGATADVLTRLDLVAAEERDETGALLDLVVEAHEDDFGLSRLRSAGGVWRAPRLDGASGHPGAGAGPRPRRDAGARPAGADQRAQRACRRGARGRRRRGRRRAGAGRLRRRPAIARVTRRSVATLELAPGRPVWAVDQGRDLRRRQPAGVGAGASGAAAGPARWYGRLTGRGLPPGE